MLALLGVGDLGGEGREAGRGEFFPDGVAGEPQRARVDDQDALDPLAQQPRQAGQQAAAHHDVVVLAGRRPGDLDDG